MGSQDKTPSRWACNRFRLEHLGWLGNYSFGGTFRVCFVTSEVQVDLVAKLQLNNKSYLVDLPLF